MNENLKRGDNISSLTVDDLLGLLNSPIVDVVEEVKTLIKGQFKLVSERWLINGLLDYFFHSNSKRILDLMIAAPNPHSKYLLEKISEGIKGSNKFQYLSLLLYAISQNPTPLWIHNPYFNNVLQAVLQCTVPKQDSDVSVLVTGVMIIVIILPYMPVIIINNKHLGKIFQLFWSLVQWVPNSDQNLALKPHLQMAVYNLFHRLYSLYPCHLLYFMKSQALGHAKHTYFIKTLRPMLERVRFHPLLISESRETELSKTRWSGLEPNDLIYECSKLSLEPLHEASEEDQPKQIDGYIHCKSVDFFVPSSLENSFWSPAGAGQSPSPVTKSAPPTPLYPCHGRITASLVIAESPPEAAIEATPETTPYASPMPMVNPSPLKFDVKPPSKPISANYAKVNLTSALDNINGNAPVHLMQRPIFQFAPSTKPNPDVSNLSSKLQQIHLERTDSLGEKSSKEQSCEKEGDEENSEKEVSEESSVCFRRRKTGAVHVDDLENFRPNELDLNQEENIDEDESEDPPECCEEGLGAPSENSMTDLVKNVNTTRLRFLSQCGPPPNISFSRSPPTRDAAEATSPFRKQKSRSCPVIGQDCIQSSPTSGTYKDLTVSSMNIAPSKGMAAETTEMATQTEEIPILNPHEHLLDVLMRSQRSTNSETKRDSLPTSMELMVNFGKSGQAVEHPELCWNTASMSGNGIIKMQLRTMHAFALLEKTKRETYADRNRRLLSKIKKLNSLLEKDHGTSTEKIEARLELGMVKQDLVKTTGELIKERNRLSEMVPNSDLTILQQRDESTCMNREHLREKCAVLTVENQSLTGELQNCRGIIHEYERQLQSHLKHQQENQSLKKKLAQLDKKLVLMGEIQMEMRLQLKSDKTAQRKAKSSLLTQDNSKLHDRIIELEEINTRETTSLDATKQHIQELQQELSDQRQEMQQHRDDAVAAETRWRLKAEELERRNQELFSTNLTMEAHMQILKQNSDPPFNNFPQRESSFSSLFPSSVTSNFVSPSAYGS